jgi:hypothetical protein
LAVPLLCTAYLIAVILIHPEYFHLVRELGWAYSQFLRNGLLITLLFGEGSAIVLGVLIVALALRSIPKHAAVWRVLLGSLLGYFLAAVIQAKGWRYHFYPSLGLAMLLLAAMAWDAWQARLDRRLMRIFAAIPAAALATAVIVSAALAVRQMAQPLNPRYDPDPSISQLIPLLRERAGGQPVFVISPNMASGFPLTNYTGIEWKQRLPHLWPAAVAYDSATKAPGRVQFHERGAMDSIERFGLETTVHDFLISRPLMVLSLIAVDQKGWDMQRLNLLRWLRSDPDFSAAWVAYDSLGRVGNYSVWARRGTPGDISRPLPVALTPQEAPPPADVRVDPAALAAAAVFLAFLLIVLGKQRTTPA